ncbi:ATP-binding protein [Streptomyces cavernicola]|uniref:ATP-binding protein n=1 Tax=Streptomyces cavernicola TaxID=3043613 RepID=A0ABT6SJM1_9ACTN|nr:ATP-binding protein [Streptomyces sp. B-S-A6]MDI3408370.1 ATP-binding protein [Streptomyces sp. B-S-A6]
MNVEAREQAATRVRRMAADLNNEALCMAWRATEGAGVTKEVALVRGWIMDEFQARLGDDLFDEWLMSVDADGNSPDPLAFFEQAGHITPESALARSIPGSGNDGGHRGGEVSELLRGLPQGVVVVAVGAAGSGKSTGAAVARAHGYTVICLDELRQEISGDAGDQAATPLAVARQNTLLDAAMGAGEPVFLDSTNVEVRVRADLVARAHHHGRPVVALRFVPGRDVCQARNASRTGSARVPEDVLAWQYEGAQYASEAVLLAEGFIAAYTVD